MSTAKCIFIALFLNIFDQTLLLLQLPPVEDNDILKSETAIRVTTNKLFSILELRKFKTTAKMKQYSRVHNYMISQTLQDYRSLNEIAKLTRVDKAKIENITKDFIALLYKIIDEENVLQKVSKENVVKKDYDIVDEVQKFELLRTYYLGPYKSINKNILKVLEGEANVSSNNLSALRENTLSEVDNETEINNDVLQKLIDVDEHLLGIHETKFTVDDKDYNETDADIDPYWHPDESDILVSGRRVFKGKKTRVKHFPFMASIQIFKKFQCGGSIISQDLVVTAASCLQLAYNNRFYRENPSFLSVRIGTQFFESGGDHIPVLEVYFYPSYNPRNLHHNLAVLRLTRLIYFGRRAKKIELDKEASPLPGNTDGITIVGWGSFTRGDIIYTPFVNSLRYAVLNVYPLHDCKEVYSSEFVTDQHFCAGTISVGSGACNRDIGGPGVAYGVLKGIVSFGAPVCGTPDAPTVFTKIGYYYDWIEELMEQDVPAKRARTTLKPNRTHISHSPKRIYKPTQWTVSPIHHEILATPAYAAVATDLRNLDDKTIFKEFLKTMFNSIEIEEYIDTMKQTPLPESPAKSKLPDTTKRQKITPIRPSPSPTSQTPPQSSALDIFDNDMINTGMVKATRMDGAEPTVPDSSESDEFMKNFTIISDLDATKGPKVTENLNIESPAGINSQVNVKSQENVETQADIDAQVNLEDQENVENLAKVENQAIVEEQVNIESEPKVENKSNIDNQVKLESQAEIESVAVFDNELEITSQTEKIPRVTVGLPNVESKPKTEMPTDIELIIDSPENTDNPIDINNATKLDTFALIDNEDANDMVDDDVNKVSTTESPLTLFTLSTEPKSQTTTRDDKSIDESILTLLYLSDNEKGNLEGLEGPAINKTALENENREVKIEPMYPNAVEPTPTVHKKLHPFKDYTYRGGENSLKTFLSENSDILDFLQRAMAMFNTTTNPNEQQRVTRM